MTEAEVRTWMGVDVDVSIPNKVIQAMADMPVPKTDAEEVQVFTVFLQHAGRPGNG